jgi:hypothetical protein
MRTQGSLLFVLRSSNNLRRIASAVGRFLPFVLVILLTFERPLMGKADVQVLVSENSLGNDRFAPDSGR